MALTIYGNGNWQLLSLILPTVHGKHPYHTRIKPVSLQ